MTSSLLSPSVHPAARQSIKKLRHLGPMVKHLANKSYSIDLSESTNPYSPYFPDYPDIDPVELKKLYLNFLDAPHLSAQNVLFTVGSVDGMDLFLRGFAEPYKDVICVTNPTFPAYEHWATLYDLPVKKVPLTGENFQEIMVESIQAINPKIFFLCNPNNPTGTQVASEIIEKICDSIAGFVVVDEAYIEFSNQSSIAKVLNNHNNLIVLRTLSKAWGMAGARCGIVLAEERIINTLVLVQAPYSFSQPAQEWVHRCLTNPSIIQSSWAVLKKDRDNFINKLATLSCIKKVFSSQSNFVMAVLKDFDITFSEITKAGIGIVDTRGSVPDSIKISIGKHEHNEAFIKILENL